MTQEGDRMVHSLSYFVLAAAQLNTKVCFYLVCVLRPSRCPLKTPRRWQQPMSVLHGVASPLRNSATFLELQANKYQKKYH